MSRNRRNYVSPISRHFCRFPCFYTLFLIFLDPKVSRKGRKWNKQKRDIQLLSYINHHCHKNHNFRDDETDWFCRVGGHMITSQAGWWNICSVMTPLLPAVSFCISICIFIFCLCLYLYLHFCLGSRIGYL